MTIRVYSYKEKKCKPSEHLFPNRYFKSPHKTQISMFYSEILMQSIEAVFPQHAEIKN